MDGKKAWETDGLMHKEVAENQIGWIKIIDIKTDRQIKFNRPKTDRYIVIISYMDNWTKWTEKYRFEYPCIYLSDLCKQSCWYSLNSLIDHRRITFNHLFSIGHQWHYPEFVFRTPHRITSRNSVQTYQEFSRPNSISHLCPQKCPRILVSLHWG